VTTPLPSSDHRAPAVKLMWRMDGFISSCMVLVALVLHVAVDGCSAVNFEGTGGSPPWLCSGGRACVLTWCPFHVVYSGLALLKFQSRVEEDPHGAMAGWSPRDCDPCNWDGVRCVDGRVVML
jgi:hypothetical protein